MHDNLLFPTGRLCATLDISRKIKNEVKRGGSIHIVTISIHAGNDGLFAPVHMVTVEHHGLGVLSLIW